MKAAIKSKTKQTNSKSAVRVSPLHLEPDSTSDRFLLSVFPTAHGWVGLAGQDDQLVAVLMGHLSSNSVKAVAAKSGDIDGINDWNPSLRASFEAYFEGEIVDFSHFELRLPSMTPFRRQIVAATRLVTYGQTASYGELARRIGHPGAARAVGTVMSMNRFPIVVPCHRILAAGGKIGGYSSPRGIAFKQRLLEMESRAAGNVNQFHR